MNAKEARETAIEVTQRTKADRWTRIYNSIEGAVRKGEFSCALMGMTLTADEVADLEELGYKVILKYLIVWGEE